VLFRYLAGNFAPVSKAWSPTPVTWTGNVPAELLGGMYVRNGGNPASNTDLGREAHWFDGDGMLSGVWFERSSSNSLDVVPHFVNQYILTDVYLSSIENDSLRTPILPSIATLVNPLSSLLWIVWRIMRAVLIVLLSHCPGSRTVIKRISVANTSILFHDGRALATCESGPPMRVTLPELQTVGWFNGAMAEGEPVSETARTDTKMNADTLGGSGPLSWMREWTTGHPKVDHTSGELVLFNCSFAPPYVQYSIIPPKPSSSLTEPNQRTVMNSPVPGCSGGKLMHDFGVSKHHTIILDLPLSLSPANLLRNKPVLLYESKKASRFGVFPRFQPETVRWFETVGCCIFHTANTWDEFDAEDQVVAVNLLACRLTSASLVFSSGNIAPPPHPSHSHPTKSKPMSFFAKYDDSETDDPEKTLDEQSPLLPREMIPSSSSISPRIPISYDDEEQCRLYYYRFAMDHGSTNSITHQFALSAIPFEFPTVSPSTEMMHAQYIYGCSTLNESFGAALGKATKIDLIMKMDVKTLLDKSKETVPQPITGCVDSRSIDEVLASNDAHDPIKAFKLPINHFAQEPRFVPRESNSTSEHSEDDGFLVFYVFNEDQLDCDGECRTDAKSELWVLDAKTMDSVVCKIKLPTRVPYGLHGNWFNEQHVKQQRKVHAMRSMPQLQPGKWSRTRSRLFRSFG